MCLLCYQHAKLLDVTASLTHAIFKVMMVCVQFRTSAATVSIPELSPQDGRDDGTSSTSVSAGSERVESKRPFLSFKFTYFIFVGHCSSQTHFWSAPFPHGYAPHMQTSTTEQTRMRLAGRKKEKGCAGWF